MGVAGAVVGGALAAAGVAGVYDWLNSDSAYTPGLSKTEAHAKKIADELAEMKEKDRKLTKTMEENLISSMDKNMSAFLQEIETINGEKYGDTMLNINVKGVKEDFDKLKNEVVGYVGSIMDERLVATDPELKEILAEADDKKRKKNFNAFYKNVKQQAMKSLQQKIEETVYKQEKLIEDEIVARLSEVDQKMKAMTAEYTKILKIKGKEDTSLAEMQMNLMYQHEVKEIMLYELGN